MGRSPLSRARYRAILAAYGGDPRRWPASERAAMQEALSDYGPVPRSVEGLDAVLAEARQEHAPSPGLAKAILAQAPARRVPAWRLAASLAACAATGAAGGALGSQLLPAHPNPALSVERVVEGAFGGVESWTNAPIDDEDEGEGEG